MNLHHVTLLMTLHVLHTHAQFQMPFPGAMPMPMGMPAMPVQMPIVGPPQLPSVVMPYHSRTADKLRVKPRKPKKRRKPKKKRYESNSDSSSDTDSSSSSSSSDSGELRLRARGQHKAHQKTKEAKRSQVLTPVVSYVTKDGYVVYQKKIKKDRAKDWLELGKNNDPNARDIKDSASDEFEIGEGNRKKHRSKPRRNRVRDD